MDEKTLCTRVGHFTVWYRDSDLGGQYYVVRCDYVPGPSIRRFSEYERAVRFAQGQYRVWQAQQAAGGGAGDGRDGGGGPGVRRGVGSGDGGDTGGAVGTAAAVKPAGEGAGE